MKMKHFHFDICPECSALIQPVIYYTEMLYAGNDPICRYRYAACANCGYETHQHEHVADVVKEWNDASQKAWGDTADGQAREMIDMVINSIKAKGKEINDSE